jgi:hypothetical protein
MRVNLKAGRPRLIASSRTSFRRDLTKVAQYEVLGMMQKEHVRPARDDRNIRLLVSHAAQRFVDRPVPPSSRRRFAVARPSLCGRAVARRAKVAS